MQNFDKYMFRYPSDADQNCLLNSESRRTQQDVFVPEDQGVQVEFETIFFSSYRLKGGKIMNRGNINKPIIIHK